MTLRMHEANKFLADSDHCSTGQPLLFRFGSFSDGESPEMSDLKCWLTHGRVDTRDTNYILSVHFLSLLTAVLFAGSVVCPRYRLQTVFGNINRETVTSQLYRRAVRAIRLSDFPQSPSLQSLSAFVIVDSTWLREEQPLTCCSFIGVATRVAQMLGMLSLQFHVRCRRH